MLPGSKGLPLHAFFRRLGQALAAHAVIDEAAKLAHYFLFSLFPLLTFVVALTAYLPLQGALAELLSRIRPLVHCGQRTRRRSPRPRPSPGTRCAAAPAPGTRALVFESNDVLRRAAEQGDLFGPVLRLRQKLPDSW